MKCLNCGKTLEQIEGKLKKTFCGDSCRKAYSRATADKTTQSTSDISTADKTKQATADIPYKITDEKVYGRRAVIYPNEEKGVVNSLGAKWTTRPEPFNPQDEPVKDDRCIYKGDGKYLIDAGGERRCLQ